MSPCRCRHRAFAHPLSERCPCRRTKRTLFEGGVRGVGFISGAGIVTKGTVRHDKVFVGDFFLSILTAVAQGLKTDPATGERVSADATRSWRDIILPGMEPMPLLPGDGMDVWDFLSGSSATSPRTEILHEAHAVGNKDGNGNALRVGDWKIVLRTGSMWAHGTAIGSNDGWFGGPGSSDANTSGYSLPTGSSSQPWTVACKPPPASFTANFACEGASGSEKRDAMEFACLFNVKEGTSTPSVHMGNAHCPAPRRCFERPDLTDPYACHCAQTHASRLTNPRPRACACASSGTDSVCTAKQRWASPKQSTLPMARPTPNPSSLELLTP